MAKAPGFSDEENLKTALAKARNWCAADEHCLWDIQQKLKRSGCDPSDINNILHLLTKEGFINENRYALAFANGKFNLFKWGKIKIFSALRMKRIPEEIIGHALASIEADRYRDGLTTLLNKKKRELKGETPGFLNRKLVRFALQKGYEAEIVFDLLRMNDEI